MFGRFDHLSTGDRGLRQTRPDLQGGPQEDKERLAQRGNVCYALSRRVLVRTHPLLAIAVKSCRCTSRFCFCDVAWVQSSTPQPKHQDSKSQSISSTKTQLSPGERLWCPVLKSTLSGAAGAEPPMRSYRLDAVAGGLGKGSVRNWRRLCQQGSSLPAETGILRQFRVRFPSLPVRPM